MKNTYKVIGIIAIIGAAVCGAAAIGQYLTEKNAGSQYEELREEVRTQPQQHREKEKLPPDIPIDFKALKAKNADVYAWITIPGTAVDYPVLQREGDNSYYLTHTIDGIQSPEGAIYTEDYNEKDFGDPNTVIYGHDMKNGSMFQSLHNYMDKTFFEENRNVVIYTPDAIRHYKIFAAYLYDDRHILQSFDFDDREVYRQYLDRIFAIRDMNANIDMSMQVDADDKILTLSTCYGNQSDKRYLVQAVLINIEN